MRYLEYVKYGVIACTAAILFASPAVAQDLPDDQYCDPATVQYGDCDDTEVIVVPPGNPPGTPDSPGDILDIGDLIDPGDIPGNGQVSPDTGTQVTGTLPAPAVAQPPAAGDAAGDTAAATSADGSGSPSPYSVLPDTGGESWVMVLAGGAMVAVALLLRRIARV